MTRSLDAATLAALEADTATPIYFVELGPFQDTSPNTTERLHNGLGSITWGSNTWTGTGDLGSIDSVRESTSITPEALRMTLSGVTSDITNIVFNTNYYQRPCIVYLGALSAGALVADPDIVFSGFIQKIEMKLGGGASGDVVVLTAESELILFKRSRDVRYTNNELQSEFSGDTGLEYLESVTTQNVVWRGKNNNLGGGGGGQTDGAGGGGSRAGQRDQL